MSQKVTIVRSVSGEMVNQHVFYRGGNKCIYCGDNRNNLFGECPAPRGNDQVFLGDIDGN